MSQISAAPASVPPPSPQPSVTPGLTKGPVPPPQAPPSSPPPPAPTPQIFPDEPASDPTNRAAVPDEASVKQARAIVHELFAEGFADKTLKGRADLAAQLIKAGVTTNDDLVGRYALFAEACDVAVSAADLGTALRAVAEMGQRYQVNTLQLKASVLTRFAPRLTLPQDAALIAQYGVPVVKALVARQMYADAERLIPLVRDAGIDSRVAELGSAVHAQIAALEADCADYDQSRTALDKLKINPNDPETNLAAGRFYCLKSGDFGTGLPLLVKGSDLAFKAAATADMAQPTAAQARKEVGDGWWDLAGKEASPGASNALKARAAYWYRLAEPELTGLEKVLVQKRIESAAQSK